MSGNPSTSSSSGSVGGGFSSGGQASGASCNFEFDTMLGSPDAVEVATLAVGEDLVLALQENPPAVMANRASGGTVGGITQSAAEIRACMQRGFAYQARVLDISGGAVKVRVHPASA